MKTHSEATKHTMQQQAAASCSDAWPHHVQKHWSIQTPVHRYCYSQVQCFDIKRETVQESDTPSGLFTAIITGTVNSGAVHNYRTKPLSKLKHSMSWSSIAFNETINQRISLKTQKSAEQSHGQDKLLSWLKSQYVWDLGEDFPP